MQKKTAEQRGRMISSPTRRRQTDGHSFLPPSGREGDREAVEGAGGYESNGLPCMRCLPLFSLVEAEVSSLLCAFSFRHPCGAGRWGEATAPCSHPGGSHSDSHRRADILPYRYLSIPACPDPKRSSRFSLFTLHSSLLFCLPPGGRGTAKRWKEQAGTIAKI